MSAVLVIEMQLHWTDCSVCGAPTPARWGVPRDDTGLIVGNDYAGPWGGTPACQGCYRLHQTGALTGLETLK